MTTQMDGEAVLKEMVDGLEGVTPGPWDWLMSGLIRALRDDLAVPLFEVRVPHKKYQRLTKTHVQEVSNGQHIARCSPDNVRAIAAYVDHLQSALKESIRLQGEYAAEVERLKAERDAALAQKKCTEDDIDTAFCSLTIWASKAWWKQVPGDARDFQRQILSAFSRLCDTDAINKRLRADDSALKEQP